MQQPWRLIRPEKGAGILAIDNPLEGIEDLTDHLLIFVVHAALLIGIALDIASSPGRKAYRAIVIEVGFEVPVVTGLFRYHFAEPVHALFPVDLVEPWQISVVECTHGSGLLLRNDHLRMQSYYSASPVAQEQMREPLCSLRSSRVKVTG